MMGSMIKSGLQITEKRWITKHFFPTWPHNGKKTSAFSGHHRCDRRVVEKVIAAFITIVMLTNLAGDEIWTEEAVGRGPMANVAFLADHPEFSGKTTENNNKHYTSANKAYTMKLNVTFS